MTSIESEPKLKDALCASLPDDCDISVRYIHSKAKKCEPLFSPLPQGQRERTSLTSHFLTISLDEGIGQIFVYAIEVLVYTTSRLTTLFVSKADSTGFLPRSTSSPTRTISTTFLAWLSDRERARAPKRKQVISLFGRAQGQYLFPGSAENPAKRPLDDRQLIRWWVKVLDPLFGKDDLMRRGFITVPGYQGIELRQFLPPAHVHWTAGQPLQELARTRGISEHAPTRCLLPRFPDDPKARFMQDLDDEVGLYEDAGASAVFSPSKRKNGRWKVIHDLDRFWEGMEFRQECSSGRVVGFLWVVVGDETAIESQTDLSQLSDSTVQPDQTPTKTSNAKKKSNFKKRLTGRIQTRAARIKGSSSGLTRSNENYFDGNGIRLTSDGYDQAMQTLLHLDFANRGAATKSTGKWTSEVAAMCGLPKHSWSLTVHGTVRAAATNKSNGSTGSVNDLGGMIRKKKRPLENPVDATAPIVSADTPVINVLGNGSIRKKPKPTV